MTSTPAGGAIVVAGANRKLHTFTLSNGRVAKTPTRISVDWTRIGSNSARIAVVWKGSISKVCTIYRGRRVGSLKFYPNKRLGSRTTGTPPGGESELYPYPSPGARGAGHGWWWWSRPWFEHQNLRDERVEAFSSLLWEGVYTYRYVARATTPGTFLVPPPKAEEMYAPETFGRGGTDVVVIE